MPLPGWSYRQKITIQASKVPSSQSNVPVLVTEDNLNASFWGNVKADGGDIRFASDQNAGTLLPCEIVGINTGSQIAELYVKVSSISGSTNTEIWIFYGNATASQPARSDPLGSDNVWTNSYLRVYHMNEVAAADSTSNNDTCTAFNTPTLSSSGQIGNCIDFAGGGSNEYLDFTQPSSQSQVSVFAWVNSDDTGAHQGVVSSDTFASGYIHNKLDNTGSFIYWLSAYPWPNNLYSSTALSANTWYYAGYTNAGSGSNLWKMYLDAVNEATGTSGIATNNLPDKIGRENSGRYFNGEIDEVRISSTARSGDWITMQYNNQDDPSTFATAGSQESYSAYVPGLIFAVCGA